jgi:dolichyl-diphosphooligosaccharide--protein glycosyltransferase
MQDPKRTSFFMLKVLAFLVMAFLAVYFRTYSLHGGPSLSPASLARQIVDRGIRDQVGLSLQKQFPQLSNSEREKMADLQARKLESEDRVHYEAAVKNALSNIRFSRTGGGYRYLLEADPYYFFGQTEKLLETGRIADTRREGKYLEPLREAPHGHWTEILFHPYLGLYWYKIVRFFVPQAPLMKTLGFFPLLLTLLILPMYAWLGKALRLPFVASAVGMATISFSPIFIQRSALGWYDTDPYNYIFPILILAFVFQGLQNRKWFWPGVLGASFMTGLYAMFWPGWAFIGALVPASILGGLLGSWIFQRSMKPDLAKTMLCFSGIYVLGWLISAAVFLTPEVLMDSIKRDWFAITQYSLADFDLWPNIFLTVGEAGSITFQKLIFLTGNYVTFGIAVAGFLWEGFHVFKWKDPAERFRFLFFLCFAAPILLLSIKTERFSLLFVLPLAIFTGFAVTRFVVWAQGALSRVLPVFTGREGIFRAAAIFLVVLLFAPLLLITAHIVAMGIRPIMDDVWYGALTEVKSKTPENAIVDCWWPPGYFITGIAHRRVVLDGGTQYLHTSYWMSRVLMAEDEREAAGILRMINTSGEDAPDLLDRWGMEVPDAVDLLLKVTRLSRFEALRVLPSAWTSKQKEELLDKTHGRGDLPPSYLLIYNDLVEQNLAVTVVANWDFRKAKKLQIQKRKNHGGSEGLFQRDSGKRYVEDLIQTSGKWLKYMPVAALSQKEGDLVSFTNGLRVNLATKEAMIVIPQKRLQGAPASLFYPEKGRLQEKVFLRDTLDISALVFEDQGSLYSVLADARLMRSLLFRLYYLHGQGLSLFRLLVNRGALNGGTVIRVFELDRKALRDRDLGR